MCETTPPLRVTLPLDPQAPGAARRFLEGATCRDHHAAVLDDASLLVSELVTNGLRYGAPPIRLETICEGDPALLIRVSDGDAHVPTLKDADDDAESGRGMTLVDYISDAWGVDVHEAGKTVWFILRD